MKKFKLQIYLNLNYIYKKFENNEKLEKIKIINKIILYLLDFNKNINYYVIKEIKFYKNTESLIM